MFMNSVSGLQRQPYRLHPFTLLVRLSPMLLLKALPLFASVFWIRPEWIPSSIRSVDMSPDLDPEMLELFVTKELGEEMSYFALLEDLFGGLHAFSVARKPGGLNKIYCNFWYKNFSFTTKIFAPELVNKYLDPDSTKSLYMDPGSATVISVTKPVPTTVKK
jgi:hypothetical protein